MSKGTAKERILAVLRSSEDKVFLRSEFASFGNPRQVGRAIKAIIDEGLLVRVGHGIYTPAIRSPLSGNPVPKNALLAIGLVAMKKLGIEADVGPEERALREGRSTQVPMRAIISTRVKVRRKIGFKKRFIDFEQTLDVVYPYMYLEAPNAKTRAAMKEARAMASRRKA